MIGLEPMPFRYLFGVIINRLWEACIQILWKLKVFWDSLLEFFQIAAHYIFNLTFPTLMRNLDILL